MKPRSTLSILSLAGLVAAALPGCIGTSTGSAQVTEIQQLRDRVEAQQRLIVAKDEQILGQAARIQELQGLSGQRSLDHLVHIARIDFASMTGGYDDDHDGIDEGVVVYLALYDREGDTIKAAGSAHVRLLDLANPPESQLVGEAKLSPEEMRKLWYGRFMTYHYTVKIPWAGGAKHAQHKAITIVADFTELLSGQTFSAQRVVEVAGAGPAPTTAPSKP